MSKINYVRINIERICHCGARELVTPVHFALGPKVRAEKGYCRGHTMKVQMA